MKLLELNQSDLCERFSCPERSGSSAVYILLYVCSAAVVLLTVCGNLLVVISVLHFKQLHTPTNTLVLSLAVSDFFVGAFVMPPMFIWTIESCWIFKREFCLVFWLLAGFLMTFSIYNVVLIAVDRYSALSNPFLYMNRVSVRITRIGLVFIWCGVAVCNITLIYFNGNFSNFVLCPGQCFYNLNKVFTVVDLIFSFIFPLSVIVLLYARVFVIAKKHASAIRELNHHTRPATRKMASHSMKSERKAAKVLGILVSVFLMCLLPYFIYSLLGDTIELQTETLHRLLIAFCLNSTINPVIYALFYSWFRKCSRLIITLKIFHSDSSLSNVLA